MNAGKPPSVMNVEKERNSRYTEMRGMKMTTREIPLARAATMLGCRYNQTWNMALAGVLTARQTETGRWLVSLESVEKERERRTTETPSAA